MSWNRFGKFNARKVREDNYLFDSKTEHKRYLELKLLIHAKEIADLQVHPVFDLIVHEKLICRYEADFGYFDKSVSRMVYEDVKGHPMPEFKLKLKLFKVLHPDKELRILQA